MNQFAHPDANCSTNEDAWENTTNFADLNVDCKLLILDEMDIISLVKIAEMNRQFQILAIDAYRRKFVEKLIIITASKDSEISHSVEYDDSFHTNDPIVTEKLIQYFGSLILYLKIDIKSGEEQLHNIMALTNRYCEKLKRFTLRTNAKNALDRVVKPFYTVEDVILINIFHNLTTQNMELDQIFPKMHSLTMDRVVNNDWSNFVLVYPNLMHFNCQLLYLDTLAESSVVEIIKLNPQLRSLSFSGIRLKLLDIVNTHLLQLETLDLGWGDLISFGTQHVNEIHFERVSDLTMSDVSFFHMLTFDRLKHIAFRQIPTDIEEWLIFIERNSNLSTLRIINEEVSEPVLLRLIGNIPNVEEISFPMKSDANMSVIAQFLTENTNLTSLTLSTKHDRTENIKQQLDNLGDSFGRLPLSQWTASESQSGYQFQKKVTKHKNCTVFS